MFHVEHLASPMASLYLSSSMNRLATCFNRLQSEKKKAFIAYLTAGDPSLDVTPDLVFALERAGADIIELGVPFSDPLADGAVNQLAAQRALASGATLPKLLETIRLIRQRSQVPLVIFTYLNPLYRYGPAKFAATAQEVGADGVLVLDLPPEETLISGADLAGGLCRISLIAPTTPPARLTALAQAATGFIYYVSREGVTGMQTEVSLSIPEQVSRIREHATVPVCVGFGISTSEQAAKVASQSDGAIVGSALVSKIGEWGAFPDIATRLENLARPFAEAIHSV
jgi:tryptophan synthase alpha chain